MHANSREDIDVARTGDIVAVAGLKNVITGETLCDEKKPIILERMEVGASRTLPPAFPCFRRDFACIPVLDARPTP